MNPTFHHNKTLSLLFKINIVLMFLITKRKNLLGGLEASCSNVWMLLSAMSGIDHTNTAPSESPLTSNLPWI